MNVPNNETVVIYPCRYCQRLHVGHSIATPIRKLLRTENRIMRAEAALASVVNATPEMVQRQQQRLKDLIAHRDELNKQLSHHNSTKTLQNA
jgi:hypothetical protein